MIIAGNTLNEGSSINVMVAAPEQGSGGDPRPPQVSYACTLLVRQWLLGARRLHSQYLTDVSHAVICCNHPPPSLCVLCPVMHRPSLRPASSVQHCGACLSGSKWRTGSAKHCQMYAVLCTPHGLLVHCKKECDGGVSHVVAYVSTLHVWHVTTVAQLFRIVLYIVW